MTPEQANAIISNRMRLGGPLGFDYLQGRVMKVNISDDSFDPDLYDCDNGEGAALVAIRSLRERGETATPETQRLHEYGRKTAANDPGMDGMHPIAQQKARRFRR